MTPQEIQNHLLQKLSHNECILKRINELKKELLTTAPDNIDLKIGDNISITNDYGRKFKGYRVLGFNKKGQIYVNTESFWCPWDKSKVKKTK